MSDEKKKVIGQDELKDKEVQLEDLKNVSGGALSDVPLTSTTDITDDIIGRV